MGLKSPCRAAKRAVSRNDDGNLEQIMSREAAAGRDQLTRRVLDARSPWSAQLSMDDKGRWFRVTPRLDANGDKVKKAGLLFMTAKCSENEVDIPDSLRMGKGAFERMSALVDLRDLLKRQLVPRNERRARHRGKPQGACRSLFRIRQEARLRWRASISRCCPACLTARW